MWAWAARIGGAVLGKLPKRILWYALAAAGVALIAWRLYDAGYDAARAECNTAELRAAAERNAETARELRDELRRRDAIERERAAERRRRAQRLESTVTDLWEMLDDATDEVKRCARVSVPGAAIERLRDGAAAAGAGKGHGADESDRADASPDADR